MCLIQLWQIVALRANYWLQHRSSPKAAIKSHFASPGSVRLPTSDYFLLPNEVFQPVRRPWIYFFFFSLKRWRNLCRCKIGCVSMKAGRAQVENLPDVNMPIVKKHKKKVLFFLPLTWGGCLSQSEKRGKKMFETCDGKSICIASTGKKDYIVLDYIVWRVDGAGDSDTINLCFTFFFREKSQQYEIRHGGFDTAG